MKRENEEIREFERIGESESERKWRFLYREKKREKL